MQPFTESQLDVLCQQRISTSHIACWQVASWDLWPAMHSLLVGTLRSSWCQVIKKKQYTRTRTNSEIKIHLPANHQYLVSFTILAYSISLLALSKRKIFFSSILHGHWCVQNTTNTKIIMYMYIMSNSCVKNRWQIHQACGCQHEWELCCRNWSWFLTRSVNKASGSYLKESN